MVSISSTSSNTVVRAALRALEADTKTTQNRIATGLKVSSYSDNATVWTAASAIRRDVEASDNLKSNIALAKGKADVASASMKTILDLLSQMKDKAKAAQATGADTTAIASDLSGLVQQINASLTSATFQGSNWINDAADASNSVSIGADSGAAISMTFATTKLSDTVSSTDTKFKTVLTTTMSSSTTFSTLETNIGAAITEVTAYAGKMAGFSKALNSQLDFITTLNDIRNKAVGSLVDADLEEESAKAKTLEVRQQLAYQALSIGNSSQQNILMLFR